MLNLALDSFAARMRLARTAKGLTQTALGELVGMKPAQVNRYESGKNVPRDRVLAELAACLGVRSEWLLHGTGPRHLSHATAVNKALRVSTALLPEGGTEISFVLYEELRAVFMERAKREGLPLDAFLRNALLELAKERNDEREVLGLAQRVKALIEAGAA